MNRAIPTSRISAKTKTQSEVSRIGKLPIIIPENVKIEYNNDKSKIITEGQFGVLETKIPSAINIVQDNNILNLVLKINRETFEHYMVYIEHSFII